MDQKVSENKVEISSYDIASIYRKQHNHVLRDIGKLLKNNPRLAGRYFTLSYYVDKKNRKQPIYWLEKEGFIFLSNSYRSYKKSELTKVCLKRFEMLEGENTVEAETSSPVQEVVTEPVVEQDAFQFNNDSPEEDNSAEVIEVKPADDPVEDKAETTTKLPIVFEHDHDVVASSQDIADYFDKHHRHVLRDIRELIKKDSSLEENFKLSSYKIEEDGRSYPYYLMNRKGFVLLTLGFTGKKALIKKKTYLDAFVAKELLLQEDTDNLFPSQDKQVEAPSEKDDSFLHGDEQQEEDNSAEVVENKADTTAKLPIVFERGHKVLASSVDVADYYGKRHDNIIRDIRKLIEQEPSLGLLNFEESNYLNEQGKSQPCFYMDRTGFSVLVFGFTGIKATKFKVAYCRAFDSMEAKLREMETAALPSPTITPAQQREIQVAVAQRSGSERLLYQALYRELKNHFHVPSYKDIPAHCFAEAMELIDSVDLEGVVADARAASAPSQAPFDKMFTLMERETDTLEKLIEMRTETLKWLISMHQPTPTAQPQLMCEPAQEPIKKEVPPAPQTVDPVPAEDEFVLEPQYAEKKTEHMSMALRPSLAQKFKQFASSKGLSMNEAINRALESFVQAPA